MFQTNLDRSAASSPRLVRRWPGPPMTSQDRLLNKQEKMGRVATRKPGDTGRPNPQGKCESAKTFMSPWSVGRENQAKTHFSRGRCNPSNKESPATKPGKGDERKKFSCRGALRGPSEEWMPRSKGFSAPEAAVVKQ